MAPRERFTEIQVTISRDGEVLDRIIVRVPTTAECTSNAIRELIENKYETRDPD